jgi:hypothetical protein
MVSAGGAVLVWTGFALAWRRFLAWRRRPAAPEVVSRRAEPGVQAEIALPADLMAGSDSGSQG